MKVAILSGKGGAGKTLLSVNLSALDQKGLYIDCDVEEPNGHLFLKPYITQEQEVTIKTPEINHDKCTGCRECVDFCNFNALAYIGGKVKVFEEICHSCGGCMIVCPVEAISETEKVIGKITEGITNNTEVMTGQLNIGEVSGVPIINILNEKAKQSDKNVYIDCPPGSACSVMESIVEADYCIIVAEPTIYGVHNMEMVYELVTKYNKPVGIVINKYISKDNPATKFCKEHNVTILGEIPYNEKLSNINSKGLIAVYEDAQLKEIFENILTKFNKEVSHETTLNS